MLKEALKAWDPHKDEKATGDPYATLFVARLPYAACEDEDVLRREFERYGDIKASTNSQRYGYRETNGVRVYRV